ncbi:MAG TPA: hypothetical protein ENI95_08965 [Chloroflexi bacterium]|nr:hypothetical protein [Chloroflexota bacterium]
MTGATYGRKRVPVLLWPFWAVWRLLTFVLELTGRFVALSLGFVLLVVGVIASLTVIGAVIGVPLAVFGFLLILRGLF